MILTIPKLFLRPYQVTWDATVFGVFNPDFPLYIKHEDLSEIAHGDQCLSISVLQLWILHLTETSMRLHKELDAEFKTRFLPWSLPEWWTLVDGGLPAQGTPNCLPKSKAAARWIVVKCNRQKGSTECGYYVMHWMSTIILGSFRNNWEMVRFFQTFLSFPMLFEH
ncbi:hypothetical protein GmHk_06G017057 [Glycine max]|nr:hypothetical protein GmHk_06G017057 [Glycine max]